MSNCNAPMKSGPQQLLDALAGGANSDEPIIVPRRARPTAPSSASIAQEAAGRMTAQVASAYRACTAVEVATARMTTDPVQLRQGGNVEDMAFPAAVREVARRIFAGQARWVTFHGASAKGKTTGAALLVGELARLVVSHFATHDKDPVGRSASWWWHSIFWITAHELTHEADYTNAQEGEPEFANKARTARVLVLDDLGEERGRMPGSSNVPPGVLQMKYHDHEMVVIVTTGLRRAEIEAKYGIGLTRRLLDMVDPRTILIGPPRERKESPAQELERLDGEIQGRLAHLAALMARHKDLKPSDGLKKLLDMQAKNNAKTTEGTAR